MLILNINQRTALAQKCKNLLQKNKTKKWSTKFYRQLI